MFNVFGDGMGADDVFSLAEDPLITFALPTMIFVYVGMFVGREL